MWYELVDRGIKEGAESEHLMYKRLLSQME